VAHAATAHLSFFSWSRAMKWIVTTVLAAGSVLAAAHAEARKVGSARPEPNRIDIAYVEPKSAVNEPVYNLVKQHQVLEKIRDLLSPLRLPHRLLIQTRDCDGISNAWSNEDSVTVCYEYLNDIWRNAPAQTTPTGIAPIDTLIGPLLDVFLHEAAHAIFAGLRIPLLGREEDAADQFSTYMMLKFDKDEARRLILGSAYQYKGDMASPTITINQQKFADEHGTPAQRFFNLLCTAYGSDPKLFADVVEKGFLPEDRAVGCRREYAQLTHAFATLIGPHVDTKLARKLHKRWLPPITTRSKLWEERTD
jgi:hypothetical protein